MQIYYGTLHYTNYITLITLHYTTYIQLHYATLISLQLQEQLLLPQLQLQLQLECINYTTLITLQRATTNTTTSHYTTLYYTNYIALHYNTTTTTLQLHYTTLPLQLQLQLRHTTLHPAVVVRWPLQPLQPLPKTQLQPPFGPSVDSPCHPCITARWLSLKLPPPACAVLLVSYE